MTGLPDDFDNGVGNVVLSCMTCADPIVRSASPPHEWVHTEDFVRIPAGMNMLVTSYDHEAIPDVIDQDDNDSSPGPRLNTGWFT